jgi:Mce-associated membrane protein
VTTVIGEQTPGAEEVGDPTAAAETDVLESESDGDPDAPGDAAAEAPQPAHAEGIRWGRILAYGVLPGVALILAGGPTWRQNETPRPG